MGDSRQGEILKIVSWNCNGAYRKKQKHLINKFNPDIWVIQECQHPDLLKNYIINIYKTLMYRGIKGTYVYVSDKHLKEYFKRYIQSY